MYTSGKVNLVRHAPVSHYDYLDKFGGHNIGGGVMEKHCFHDHHVLHELGVLPLIGDGKVYIEGRQVIRVGYVYDLNNMDHDFPHIVDSKKDSFL